MSDCIFCKIVSKEIPSNVVYEDDMIMAFHDLNPAAPSHVLVIPKVHFESLNDMTAEHAEVVAHLNLKLKDIASTLGIAQSGYRVVCNCGSDAGQEVKHLHYHVLGGRNLQWPPG
jgi:histidine triad (HIT) family protein